MPAYLDKRMMCSDELEFLIKKSAWSSYEAIGILLGRNAHAVKLIVDNKCTSEVSIQVRQSYELLFSAIMGDAFPVQEADDDYWVQPMDFLLWMDENGLESPENFPMDEREFRDRIFSPNPKACDKQRAHTASRKAQERTLAIADYKLSQDPKLTAKELAVDQDVIKFGQSGSYKVEQRYKWITSEFSQLKKSRGRPKKIPEKSAK